MILQKIRGKKVVVMGLGIHGGGVGAVKFLAQQGAKILVTDLKNKKQLEESLIKLKKYRNKITYILGKHRARDFKNTDLIIKNPGVPKESKYLKIAKKNKIPIETDIGLFFELCPSKNTIGVTGTKGKSTTATLIAKLLATKYRVVLAGNIRNSVLEELTEIDKNTIVVLELSSWQLEDLLPHKKSPHIAIITNMLQDHLNRYQGMKDYIKAKKLIFKFQKSEDYLILNAEDKIVKDFKKEAIAKTIFYSKKLVKKYKKYIKLPGEHNSSNVAGAVTIAQLFKITDFNIKKTLGGLYNIPGRLEFVKTIKGIKYYNDTTATTPEATLSALKTFPRNKIILIAGGTDKNLNFKKLAPELQKIKALILLPGTASKKILEAIVRLSLPSLGLALPLPAKNMKKAVRLANKNAKKGDIVLLSPGCASFGLFKHEFDRGEQFLKEI